MDVAIGVDFSLSNAGICRLRQDGKFKTFSFKAKDMPKEVRGRNVFVARMARYDNHIDNIVATIARTPNVVGIYLEGYSYASQGRAVITLGEVGGILRNRLESEFGKVHEVPPSSLKQFILGKGSGDKIAMAMGVYKRWHLEFPSNDECDAFGLAQLGACCLGWWPAVNAAQRQAVEAVLNGK